MIGCKEGCVFCPLDTFPAFLRVKVGLVTEKVVVEDITRQAQYRKKPVNSAKFTRVDADHAKCSLGNKNIGVYKPAGNIDWTKLD